MHEIGWTEQRAERVTKFSIRGPPRRAQGQDGTPRPRRSRLTDCGHFGLGQARHTQRTSAPVGRTIMTRSTSTSPEESGETIRGAGAPSRRSIIRATAAVGTAAGLTAVARVGSARADDSSVAATAGSGGGHAKPSIVMAHGAFAESSSWDDVVTILHRHGHHVVSVAVPLRGVAYDSSYFSDVLRTIEGPVVLVGHSYGGAVISASQNHSTPRTGAMKRLRLSASANPDRSC